MTQTEPGVTWKLNVIGPLWPSSGRFGLSVRATKGLNFSE